MEKDLFIDVLKHYSKCSEGEALKVLSLKDDFPYSQLLHALSARLSKDHGLVDQSRELQLAAVYAADRGVLKDVMTLDDIVVEYRHKPKSKVAPKTSRRTPLTAALPARETELAEEQSTVSEIAADEPSIAPTDNMPDAGNMADQVMVDLEKLHQLKHNFEMMFVDGGGVMKPGPVVASVTPAASVPDEQEENGGKPGKSKKERIIELARALEVAKKSDAEAEPKVPAPKVKKQNPAESIIEEIVSSKHEIEPESEKQKEQLEIIDQFIKTQPSISNSKDKPLPAPAGDLSTIKTGEFSDNIVSETLVEILLKQGKKDKAIEVLKKLIWKFPQKKAYFAAQIEELKK